MFNLDIVANDGTCKKLNVIAVFHDENNKYIAYSDGTMHDGKEDLIISKYEEHDGLIDLFAIDNEKDWEFANKYLDENVFGGEDID